MNRAELLKIAKPILFNVKMTQAILDNRKGATRRVIKPQPDEKHQFPLGFVTSSTDNKNIGSYGWGIDEYGGHIQYAKIPYKVGDYLYVRETFGFDKNNYFYKADFSNADLDKIKNITKWLPSIHMPKAAARIFLRVTDVRIERLQDITEEQAIKEGCEGLECSCHGTAYACTDCYNTGWLEPPQVDFIFLWNSTIKKQDIDKYGWDANPWVIVIEFERVKAYE